MPTMKDVAEKAGVSISTVSRVISGRERISRATQERVRKAMKELGFYPNAIARSLASRTSKTIGLVISRSPENAFANSFFPEVIRGIGSVLNKHGFYPLLIMEDRPEVEEAQTLSAMRSRRVDGAIVTTSRVSDSLLHHLVDEKMKFVLIGRVLDDLPISYVDNDNVKVGYQATKHLIDAGYQRVAMISGDPQYVVSLDRIEGYKKALHDAKMEFRKEYLVTAGFTREAGEDACRALLTLDQPPDAIFAADDTMASGAVRAILKSGLRIPEDVGVIGVNDDPLASLMKPSLSTIRIPVFDLGVWAAEILMDLLSMGEVVPRQMVLPGTLVVRESSSRRGFSQDVRS